MNTHLDNALEIVNQYRLSPALKMTMLTLLHHADENREVQGSAREFAKVIGISPRSFQRFISMLLKRKLIMTIPQKAGNGMIAANKYILMFYTV